MSLRGVCVLVADDDPAVVDWIVEVLEHEGVRTEGVTSAQQLLERAASAAYDLVIADMHLGWTCGCELPDALRAFRQPFLLSTTFATPDLIAAALARGASGLLSKPFPAAELLAQLRHTLSR